ncbi:transglutaminase-like domain-containing protein [Acetobacterium tundrae]|uniref:Transglutaminase domain-containing protein n=1 Tax=Acetobacterium tundrae TaxID=132932 RepID=A0ABR6WL73_9FIRM|nr:transglutaminase-like domain-containing protein [Acetobacterium tundrae]MBC3797267.1 transglutaminase domain-containing protein [Acetobacterium tundrae]
MYKHSLYSAYIISLILITLLSTSCTNSDDHSSTNPSSSNVRSNAPMVLQPAADGIITYGSGSVTIDASHTDDGYVMINYNGSSANVKLQITDPAGVVYTYNLHNGYETFPLTGGDGIYLIVIFENVSGDQYATAFSQSIDIKITNQYGPYLYPNQFVDFDASSKTVSKGSELANGAKSDLDVVTNVYNYVIKNIKYDNTKALSVKSGYIPVVDEILASGNGICFDYAAVMATMLRSQNIPTRLEVGYAGTAYHAWISVHLDDIGWVNGIIEFDGSQWKLMDPTFASNNTESELKKFIGDGSNYQTKYIY